MIFIWHWTKCLLLIQLELIASTVMLHSMRLYNRHARLCDSNDCETGIFDRMAEKSSSLRQYGEDESCPELYAKTV